jgi:hypothetical protein
MSDADNKLNAIGSDLPFAPKPSKKALAEENALALERDRENNNHRLQQDSLKLGAIGRWFGSRENAIVYIVALLVIICLFAAAVLAIVDDKLRASAFEVFKTIAIALVGFFAGRSMTSKDD